MNILSDPAGIFNNAPDEPKKEMIETLIKHLEELRTKAVNEHPTDKLKECWKYYSGESGGESSESKNQYNVISGIVDTKKTLILDNEIVSTVMPRLKTFVDNEGLALQNDIADILKDINSFVLDQNNFEKVKSEVVLDKLVYGIGITETVWEQNENELGDIRINSIDPLNFFPDMSAKKIEDCNYIFIKESYSPITLKKKYPQYASKMQGTIEHDKTSDSDDPTGITTLGNDYNTTQAYSYGSQGISKEKQKNIIVWKCYLKDDSTFLAKETGDSADPKEAELRFLYPNGRLIVYVDGAKDYILEDKAIDYPFGFPIDIYTTSTKKLFDLSTSAVKRLKYIQDRINRAFERVQYLIAAYLSLFAVSDTSGLVEEDIVNQAVILIENMTPDMIAVFTNNTLSELTHMIEYIDKLENYAYKIARVNPMMISGERPKGVTSGEQIVQLNESPMLSIKEEQRHFKYFVCEQGQKNIALIQLFYNTPRMIRLTNSKQVAELPAMIDSQDPENTGLVQQPIKIWEQRQREPERDQDGKVISNKQGTYYEAIREIQGDLSIGEYDIKVIAGTEMPRSRSERAQITMQLAKEGFLGDNRTDIAEIVLTSMDYPLRHQIIDKMREQESQMKDAPPPEPPTDKIQVNFKDLSTVAQAEWYLSHGFPKAAEELSKPERQNLELLKENKELFNG